MCAMTVGIAQVANAFWVSAPKASQTIALFLNAEITP